MKIPAVFRFQYQVRIPVDDAELITADKIRMLSDKYIETKFRIVRRADRFSFDIEMKSRNDYNSAAGITLITENGQKYILVDTSLSGGEIAFRLGIAFLIPAVIFILGMVERTFALQLFAFFSIALFYFLFVMSFNSESKRVTSWFKSALNAAV